MRWYTILVLASVAFTVASSAFAGDPATSLSSTIDRHISQKHTQDKVTPAPRADDATFFRRIHLALGGRIPSASESRAFIASSDPDKRTKAVDKLLNSAAYATHMTTVWRGWLLPEAIANPEVAGAVPGFEAWLRNRVQANQPMDKFVLELLTLPLDGRQTNQPRTMAEDGPTTTPIAFYNAKEGKPENLAAATSKLFLGVQLECAQCHNHPFAKWSREQFWGLAAFYGGVTREGGLREIPNRREMTIPSTDRTVPATFLDDQEPAWQFRKSPRVTLANWIVAKENPFFAKATVNRLWGLLFGVGIVDPVDDFNDQNPPSHPELLEALATAFTESGYDAKFILRSIVLSETYGRSSATIEANQRNPRLFAAFPTQGLTPEQLFDSLSVVVGTPLEGPGGNYLQNNGSPKRQFLETFNRMGKPTETQTTILQALTLMNGNLVGEATKRGEGRTLSAILELPGLSASDRVEAIYFMVLNRKPTDAEQERTRKYVKDDKSERYADVLWVLLNSAEFRTLH